MACMEHHCSNCNWHEMDNDIYKVCPICKSDSITNWFDEEFDHYPEEAYQEDEDD